METARDEQIKQQLLQAIEDVLPPAVKCRKIAQLLEGGCSVPIAKGISHPTHKTTQVLKFNAIVVSPDGNEFVVKIR